MTTGSEAWKALLARNFIATPTVVARRALLVQVDGFDEMLKVAENQDMWIRLTLAGPVVYVAEPYARACLRQTPAAGSNIQATPAQSGLEG